jgi:hypothetical protein
MITIEESMPTKSKTYLAGLDIFYSQFNDVFFYIEDENQENFFFCILKKLFKDIRLEKIFPLGGKENVIEESLKNIGNKSKVFIVDKDFDDILNNYKNQTNLFYLDRYSIENYLIEISSFIDYIVGERPRTKRINLPTNFNLDTVISNIGVTIGDLIILYILVQKYSLGLSNVDQNYERFVTYNGIFNLNGTQYSNYETNVSNKLQAKDGRLSIKRQMESIKRTIHFGTSDFYIKHIPGKYLLKMIKYHIEHQHHIPSRDCDSFNYRIAEKCTFDSLDSLKTRISEYIK